LKYIRQELPYQTDKAKQDACDKVLSIFCTSKDKANTTATILQMNGKDIISDLSEDERAELLFLSKIVTFSSLSVRQYFRFMNTYWNSSNLSMYIQSFNESAGQFFAIETKRRDGSILSGYDASENKTYRPYHVHNTTVDIDISLMNALTKARQSTQEEKWLCYEEGIDSFNRANTDNADIMSHDEIIMIASAFQRICDSSYKEDDLVAKLLPLFIPDTANRIADLSKYSLKTRSGTIFLCNSLFEYWIRDLYRLRNGCAHGKQKDSYQSIWDIKEHLLFASYIYPLIVKTRLSNEGFYVLTDRDLIDINVFEALLDYDDIMTPIEEKNENIKYPWNEIRSTFKLRWGILKSIEQGKK
jgi:hypothetical protein